MLIDRIKTFFEKLLKYDESIDFEHKKNTNQKEIKLKPGEITTILFPDFKEVKKIQLKRWYVNLGSYVKSGDVLLEIETDKTIMEFESYYSGKIIWISPKTEFYAGMEICKIEGINENPA